MDTEEILAEEEFTSPSYMGIVTEFLGQYGWYMVLIGIILGIVARKFIPEIEAYNKKREEAEYAAKYHKNPDLVAVRLAAQEARARELQEKYDQEAKEYQKKMEEKESKKREEWLSRHGEPGEKLGKSKTLKSEYNPLMGDNSRGYRPVKKSSCGGGGCGR